MIYYQLNKFDLYSSNMKNYYGRKIVVKLYINIFQLATKFHKTKEIKLYTGLEKHRDPTNPQTSPTTHRQLHTTYTCIQKTKQKTVFTFRKG